MHHASMHAKRVHGRMDLVVDIYARWAVMNLTTWDNG
jgi:hypothetical protein